MSHISFSPDLAAATLAKVSKGQRKMCANTIMFGQPVAKLFNVLPVPRDDLDECLAIIFVGPCAPTKDDLSRTPFVVRHKVLFEGLTWLKRNHADYHDITICIEHINSFIEGEVPVCVIHREGNGSVPTEGLSVHEVDEERGVEKGPCPFSVQGLTGSEFAQMSYQAKQAASIKYYESGGKVLAYGREADPQSIYHNPHLFPSMFPWLFPYGLGGFENMHICTKIDRITHVRHLLQYADCRFQTDECFPFMMFNHEQIRSSTHGGFLLTTQCNFPSAVDKILSINPQALDRLIDRGKNGEYVRSGDEDEKKCFELMSIVDHVAGHVQGSATSRKYERTEIKSLIIAEGVPVFFITFAPVDFKHPLCLYYCGQTIDLMKVSPNMPNQRECLRAIAANPVACAKFFNMIVNAFITHILKADTKETGLFGKTKCYYGTVESQGQLTLHLHLLLWIASCLSPQDIRECVLRDETFRANLTEWLELCVHGEYLTGDLNNVAKRHEKKTAENCRDPATTWPSSPGPVTSEEELNTWYEAFKIDTDDVLYASNRHDPGHNKGCLRGAQPYCRARFPRETFEGSVVDIATGAIRLKKTEPWINTFHPVLSHVLRCNSDVTCLLSGTQVKAVIAYVTDYVTKTSLNTHTFFETVRTILDRNPDLVNSQESARPDAAHKLISKVVNALSALQETGGPAVCSYLLGHPDHYTNKRFRPFFWRTYLQHFVFTSYEADKRYVTDAESNEKVLIGLANKMMIPVSKVNDYQFRPIYFENWSLYDYMIQTDSRRLRPKSNTTSIETDDEDDVSDSAQYCTNNYGATYPYTSDHPSHETQGVFLLKESETYVLNFIGGTLPRVDNGDREEYCMAMMMLFYPSGWREGRELKTESQSWDDAFEHVKFSPEHMQVMKNMNVLYECLDARDDYAAQRRLDDSANCMPPIFSGSESDAEIDNGGEEPKDYNDADMPNDVDGHSLDSIGEYTARMRADMNGMQLLILGLTHTRKNENRRTYDNISPVFSGCGRHTPSEWKETLERTRKLELERKTGTGSQTCTGHL